MYFCLVNRYQQISVFQITFFCAKNLIAHTLNQCYIGDNGAIKLTFISAS